MQFVDLVVEGIRKFSKSQKITFKPGFNLIFGSSESGKSTLAELMLELLFPDRFREEEVSMLSWQGGESARAGLTITHGNDTYRILRDFRNNRIALSRLNPHDQKYETMAEDAAKVGSILADVFSLPAFETYRNLFVNQPDRLPSVLPLEIKIDMPKPATDEPHDQVQVPPGGFPGAMPPPGQAPGGFGYQDASYPGYGPPGTIPPGMMPPPPGMMPPGMSYPGTMDPSMSMPGMMGYQPVSQEEIEEKEKKLKDLKDEYEKAKELEELQFDVDGLQAKIFEIEAKRKKIDKIDETLKQAEEILNQYFLFKDLPENMDERLDRFNSLQEMQARETEKIDNKAYLFDDELYNLQQQPPFHKTPLFNLGVGLLAVGLASVFFKGFVDFLKYTQVLLLGGIGLAGYIAYQHFTLQGQIEQVRKKVEDFENQRSKIIKKFEVEGAVTRRLLEQADTESIDSLKEKVEKYRQTEQKAKNMERRKREMMIELDWDNLQKEENNLRDKINGIEDKIRRYPPLSMDANEMKREIKELEEFLDRYKPRTQEAGTSVPDLSSPGAPATQAQVEAKPPDPGSTRMDDDVPAALLTGTTVAGAFERTLASAATLLNVDRKKLIEHVSNRFELYLQALTGKRYQRAEWSKEETLKLVSQDGVEASLAQISPSARDTVYFALQFTLLEVLVQKLPFPLILDDPYKNLDETSLQVASQALKRLSEKTQIILFSTQRIHTKHAGHSLNLG